MTGPNHNHESNQSPSGRAGPSSSSGKSSSSKPGGATITSQVQGALDEQVVRGAKMISSVARSAKTAADALKEDAPQIAGLVRGVADRAQQYSRDLEQQSVADLYEAASDFTKRQPALVFGVAALAGFLALRTLKSGSADQGSDATSRLENEEFHGS